jgi:hypothetical protein
MRDVGLPQIVFERSGMYQIEEGAQNHAHHTRAAVIPHKAADVIHHICELLRHTQLTLGVGGSGGAGTHSAASACAGVGRSCGGGGGACVFAHELLEVHT